MKAGTIIDASEVDESQFLEPGEVDESQFVEINPTPVTQTAQATPKPGPTPAQSALAGVGQGVTFGWGDELMGGLGALDELSRRAATGASGMAGVKPLPGQVPVEREDLPLMDALKARYQRERNANRTDLDVARETNPKAFVGGQLGGAFLTPNPGAKGGALARILGMAGTGALSAAGSSEGQTAAQVAGDAAMGGAIGAGFGGLSAGLGGLADKFGDMAARIRADKLAKTTSDLESAAASAAGVAGNATQRVLRTVEDAVDTLKNPSAPQALKDQAQKVLSDPEVLAHYEQALFSKFGNAPAAAKAAEAAKSAASEAATNIGDRAMSATEEYFAKNTPLNELTRRLGPLALRSALGAAGGYLGGEVADAAGVDKGMGMAGGFGAGFSAPGTVQALRNFTKSPAVQAGLASRIQGLLSGGGQLAAPVASVAAQQATEGANAGRDENRAAIDSLAKRFGIDIGQDNGEHFFLSNGQSTGR